MKALCLLLFICSFTVCFGQQKYIKGLILDKTQQDPLPFVTLSIEGYSPIYSDFDGIFIQPVTLDDLTIALSYKGYEEDTIHIKDITHNKDTLCLTVYMRNKDEDLGGTTIYALDTGKGPDLITREDLNNISLEDITVSMGSTQYPSRCYRRYKRRKKRKIRYRLRKEKKRTKDL